jgi:hypothetical protein
VSSEPSPDGTTRASREVVALRLDLESTAMTTLTKQAPRPRRSRVLPSYPRCIGLGAMALVAAACGGSVDVRGETGAGAGSIVTTTSSGTTMPPYTTTTNVGGSGGEGGYAGAGGTNWGGGLSGDIAEPYDGGVAGSAGAGGSTGIGGAGAGGAADSGS